ncbi:MAG: class I SAM-dependent methyltransferase [Candidatus Omnitrophota bacterium]
MDIGSGIGNIVQYYPESTAEEIILVDEDEVMTENLRQMFERQENVRVLKNSILQEELLSQIPLQSIDTITCVNVLEHIKEDVKALENMKRLLKKSGRIVLLVPALDCLYGSLDALVGHCRRYDKKTLEDCVTRAGLRTEKQYYMNILGTVSWFISGRVLKSRRFNPRICRWLDAGVPAISRLESKLRLPFGQSLVAVCRYA